MQGLVSSTLRMLEVGTGEVRPRDVYLEGSRSDRNRGGHTSSGGLISLPGRLILSLTCPPHLQVLSLHPQSLPELSPSQLNDYQSERALRTSKKTTGRKPGNNVPGTLR